MAESLGELLTELLKIADSQLKDSLFGQSHSSQTCPGFFAADFLG